MNSRNVFRISFALKNTYRVNSILYSLKQIPLVKRILPESLYTSGGLKIFAGILAGLWEIISAFGGKFLYLLIMVFLMGMVYRSVPEDRLFLHILVFLTAVGAFTNTYMFNPGRDKYYAMILMRMDAKKYTLTNYFYSILKVIVGFLPFTILFGLMRDVPLWLCILLPFSVAGSKLILAAVSLTGYRRTGRTSNENRLGRFGWIILAVLTAAAYLPPAAGITLPLPVSAAVLAAAAAAGAACMPAIVRFDEYREMYRQILTQSMSQMDEIRGQSLKQSRKVISADTSITSRKKGFEYLNELFIRRHQKVLWKSSKRIAGVCAGLICFACLAFFMWPEVKPVANSMLLTYLPYFVFIMYAINRGTGFTRVLFMNCDHSLLTYAFYKQPKSILKLFQIRLREIVKVNLLPAAVIGAGLALLLFVSGGTENPLNYAVLFISIVCLSIFFSVHYLTIYYLLQPYNAGTEMKSGTYQIILWVTYLVCFFLMQVRMSTLVFGLMTILFCVLYCIVASILVFRFAPRTFRLRM